MSFFNHNFHKYRLLTIQIYHPAQIPFRVQIFLNTEHTQFAPGGVNADRERYSRLSVAWRPSLGYPLHPLVQPSVHPSIMYCCDVRGVWEEGPQLCPHDDDRRKSLWRRFFPAFSFQFFQFHGRELTRHLPASCGGKSNQKLRLYAVIALPVYWLISSWCFEKIADTLFLSKYRVEMSQFTRSAMPSSNMSFLWMIYPQCVNNCHVWNSDFHGFFFSPILFFW